jgi:hypothetical protein
MGLAAKNAILMIEFAEQGEKAGKDPITAVLDAARMRLRPILMTSCAFIFGVLPLAIATGAGANARIAIGTSVIGGMLTATGWPFSSSRCSSFWCVAVSASSAARKPMIRSGGMKKLSLIAALALALPGGIEARPRADQPADPTPLPIPSAWPKGEAYVLPTDAALPSYSYAQVLADPRLIKVIELALAKNQDLAVALANIEAARNQYLVQRGALFPEIDANGGFTHAG